MEASEYRKDYKNFNVAIYCRIYDVLRMTDPIWLEKSFSEINRFIKFNKVYIETFRDMILADKETLLKIKDFFERKGIRVSGGICTVMNEREWMRTFCYSNPDHVDKIKEIVAYTSEIFDEVILDDFFFTNCKCELCVKQKGEESWTKYRLKILVKTAEELIRVAKKVNPKVNLIIKYPNWYEHYQFLGYDLDVESKIFDMIYTGTETRDPEYTYQHLQPYQSYLIMRYLENVKPGKNGGGWVDPFARRVMDLFAQQIRLTLFAKAKEITLFCYDVLIRPAKGIDGSQNVISTVAHVAGNTLEDIDAILHHLGQPIGVPCYKPYNSSSGEDFLPNYFGMMGVPLDLRPDFPRNEKTIFLTENAKFDNEIIEKIKEHLLQGGNVIITSGLLKALQNKGLSSIVEVECADKKVLVNRFSRFMFADVYQSDTDILIPQIRYPTNDVWEIITCLSKGNGYPLLLRSQYAKGILYILTIPDNFGDLYHLPQEVLTEIRRVLTGDIKVYIEGPSRACLFLYDNNTFIIESFLPHFLRCNVVVKSRGAKLYDLILDKEFEGSERGEETVFPVFVEPHHYRIYKFKI
ncbi:MAG: permease [Candidatus Bathyarchaeia archaeon]